MKKIGIVCDNYKIEKFKLALKEKFPSMNVDVSNFTKGTSLIKFTIYSDEEFKEVNTICNVLQINFNQGN